MLIDVTKNTPGLLLRGIIKCMREHTAYILLVRSPEDRLKYHESYRRRIFTVEEFLNSPRAILDMKFVDRRSNYSENTHPMDRYEIDTRYTRTRGLVIEEPYKLPDPLKMQLMYRVGGLNIDTLMYRKEKRR